MSTESNLLQVRKPGTPTKRPSLVKANGDENKIILGNKSIALEVPKTIKIRKAEKTVTQPRFANIPEALPQHLRDRLQSFRVPSADEILNKERKAAKKAKSYNEAKSKQAALHSAKVDSARKVKIQFNSNFSLLGSTIPTTERQVKPVKLPFHLQKRLETLREKSSVRTAPEAILAKEATVARKKKLLVNHKLCELKKHHDIVKEKMTLKDTKLRYDKTKYDESILPQNLISRLQQFRAPEKSKILRKEARVSNRAAAIRMRRVRNQKFHLAKVAGVKATKKMYEENFTLLGNTIKSNQRQIKHVKLPNHLQQRLQTLSLKSKRSSLNKREFLDNEDKATVRRLLATALKVESRNKHHRIVETRMMKRATVARYDSNTVPEFLPERLRERLESYRAKTKEAILRKEARASLKAQRYTKAKKTKAQLFNARVEKAKKQQISFRQNFSLIGSTIPTGKRQQLLVELPKHLKLRLKSLRVKCHSNSSSEALLKKTNAASNRRIACLKTKAEERKKYNLMVQTKMKVAMTKSRYQIETLSENMPDHLKQRLASYRAPKSTTIQKKLVQAQNRRTAHLQTREQTARFHMLHISEVLEQKKSFSEKFSLIGNKEPTPLPKRLQDRLAILKQEKFRNIDTLAREKTVSKKREYLIKANVDSRKQRNARVKTKMLLKSTKPRYDNVPEFLPENLKQRLSIYRTPTATSINQKLLRAENKKARMISARKKQVTLHLLHVSDIVAEKKSWSKNFSLSGNKTPIRIPLRLQKRLVALEQHKRGSKAIIAKEQNTYDRQKKLVQARVSKRKTYNKNVKARMKSNTTQTRYESVADALPDTLKERLSKYRVPKQTAIERKWKRAENQRQGFLKVRQQKCMLQSKHAAKVVALRKSFSENFSMSGKSEAVTLPKRFQARLQELTQLRHSKAEILEKENRAHEKRKLILFTKKENASNHNLKVASLHRKRYYKARYEKEKVAVFVPNELKHRLHGFLKPTMEKIGAIMYNATQKHQRNIEAKKANASLHFDYVRTVCERKTEMNENMQLLGSLTKDHTSKPVILPSRLAQRAKHLEGKHHQHSPEVLLQKEQQTAFRREAFTNERVLKARAHGQKVKAVLNKKQEYVDSRHE